MNHRLYRYFACAIAGAALALALEPSCKADVLSSPVEELTPVNTIGVDVFSIHSNHRDPVADRDWNDVNPGIYFRHENVVIGTYYNSIRKESFYAGFVYRISNHFDIILGAVTGYNGPGYSAKPIMPLVIPSFHFDLGGATNYRVDLIPQAAKGGASALHFSVEWKF